MYARKAGLERSPIEMSGMIRPQAERSPDWEEGPRSSTPRRSQELRNLRLLFTRLRAVIEPRAIKRGKFTMP